jgi:hypothetical protein
MFYIAIKTRTSRRRHGALPRRRIGWNLAVNPSSRGEARDGEACYKRSSCLWTTAGAVVQRPQGHKEQIGAATHAGTSLLFG